MFQRPYNHIKVVYFFLGIIKKHPCFSVNANLAWCSSQGGPIFECFLTQIWSKGEFRQCVDVLNGGSGLVQIPQMCSQLNHACRRQQAKLTQPAARVHLLTDTLMDQGMSYKNAQKPLIKRFCQCLIFLNDTSWLNFACQFGMWWVDLT